MQFQISNEYETSPRITTLHDHRSHLTILGRTFVYSLNEYRYKNVVNFKI